MKSFFKFFSSLSLFAVAFSPLPSDIPHSSEGWYIDSFRSDMTLQSDGNLGVEETIAVDFRDLDKHGIYRDLPVTYENQDGSKHYTLITVKSVRMGNDTSQARYSIQQNGANMRIKIGDPDKTISGKQIYIIDYTVAGVIMPYDQYDELYWNATGNNWPVPILSAEATVTIPQGEISQATCFEGGMKSADTCPITVNKVVAKAQSTRPFYAYEGLTVATGFTKGIVPIVTVNAIQSLINRYWYWSLLPIPIAGTLLFLLFKWYRSGRDIWKHQRFLDDPQAKEGHKPVFAHETVVVEYDPPEKLRPAELGALLDEKADTTDVTATIVDLAGRGYMTIEELEKKGIFGETDYILKRTDKDETNLLDYERFLLDKLFASAKHIKLSSLKQKFYKDLAEVKKKIYQSAMDKQLFQKNPDVVRSNYSVIGFILLFVLFFAGVFAVVPILLPLVIGVGLSGALFIIFSKIMPSRTAKGHELYRRAKGYELFLSKAEKYRQQFFERKNMFNEILPYAIVMGLTEKYMHAFKELGLEPPTPTWYVGTHPFHAASFSGNLNSFSQSLSSTLASAPRSSGSGGGGGGFSGGGFGGGGGGSW